MTANRNNILVVDDEIDIIHSIEDVLEDEYQVWGSTSGVEALSILRNGEFSVIISDQRMPVMPGTKFLEKAKDVSAATRIMMTGYSDIDAVGDAVNLGHIYAYVAKPWDAEPFKELVARAAERYRLLQELQKERDLLHALMSNIPDAVYFKDRELRYIAANAASARLHGAISPAAMIGRRADEVHSGELSAKMTELENRVLAHGKPIIDLMVNSTDSEGRELWYSVTNVPLATEDGNCRGVVTVAKDVTDRHSAELQLRESRERFRAVLDGTPASIYLNDVDGSYVMVNRRFAETFGVELAAISGKFARDIFSQEVAREITALQQEVLKAKRQVTREIRMPDASGTLRTFYVSQVPIPGHDGSIRGICAIQADVTEQRAVEDQLRQSQKLESIGHLTGGIAHDFNNLLTIIMGNLDIMLREVPADSKVRERVVTAKKAAVRGHSLTRQLLVFARKQDLLPEVISVAELFREFAILAGRTLGQAIVFKINANSTWRVRVDPGQLESALLNLCINARDAMSGSGVLALESDNVDLAVDDLSNLPDIVAGRYVVISISDTGSGIDANKLDHIFEPFFTTKEKGKGTGLGLSMVYGFVRQSDGTIHVHSEPGLGTTFKIYLPAVIDDASSRSSAVDDMPSIFGDGRVVLVVEDDADVRETAVNILESFGFKVHSVAGAADAVSFLTGTDTVDLLFTDVLMPGGLNGLQLVVRVRESRPELPVILTSGFTANVIENGHTLPSRCEFLAKPYLERQLIEKINVLLGIERDPQLPARS